MLSKADKQRIEAEEAYRTQVREKATRAARTGTTGRMMVRYALAVIAGLMLVVLVTMGLLNGDGWLAFVTGGAYTALLVGPLFLLTYVSRVA